MEIDKINSSDFVGKVKDTIKKYHMFRNGDKVIVGVSGGADSIALLVVLKALSEEYNLDIYVLHLNHLIRGVAAERDAHFSNKICDLMEIPCKIVVKDVRALSKLNRTSLEEAGRQVRYEEFEKYREQTGASKIALAHHMNDQAETILLNLVRGTGIKGLGGMQAVRDTIVRPLIEVDKNSILDFCDTYNLKYVEDASNSDNHYSRNRIRNELIPYIEHNFNKNIVNQLHKMGTLLREDESYVHEYIHDLYEKVCVVDEQNQHRLNIQMLKGYQSGVRKRIYRLAIESIASALKNIEAKHIDLIDGLLDKETSKIIDLPAGLKAKVSYNTLIIFNETAEIVKFYYYVGESVDDIYIEEINTRVNFKVLDYNKSESFPRNDYTKWFDYDKMKNGFSIRSREIGDFIRLKGMIGKKKIKHLLIDEKVEADKRDYIPLVTNGHEVIWAIGYRANKDYMITENTIKVLEISIIKEEEYEI